MNTEVMWNNMKKCLLFIVSGLVGSLRGKHKREGLQNKLPVKWMKEENRRMSGTKKEGKTTEDSRMI
jgi:hypothetical protein